MQFSRSLAVESPLKAGRLQPADGARLSYLDDAPLRVGGILPPQLASPSRWSLFLQMESHEMHHSHRRFCAAASAEHKAVLAEWQESWIRSLLKLRQEVELEVLYHLLAAEENGRGALLRDWERLLDALESQYLSELEPLLIN